MFLRHKPIRGSSAARLGNCPAGNGVMKLAGVAVAAAAIVRPAPSPPAGRPAPRPPAGLPNEPAGLPNPPAGRPSPPPSLGTEPVLLALLPARLRGLGIAPELPDLPVGAAVPSVGAMDSSFSVSPTDSLRSFSQFSNSASRWS